MKGKERGVKFGAHVGVVGKPIPELNAQVLGILDLIPVH